jgi:hypothetical protein
MSMKSFCTLNVNPCTVLLTPAPAPAPATTQYARHARLDADEACEEQWTPAASRLHWDG